MRKVAMPVMAVLGLTIAATCSADVIFKMKQTSDVQSKKPSVSTGSLVFDANRMTTRWDDDEKSRVIFRGDKNLLWVVDDHEKSYQQVDKAFIDQMAAQVADAKAEMQARIDKMPPEQRAQAEEMMKQYGGASAGASSFKLDYRKTGATKMINGHLCTKYDTYDGKDLISYAWVAPYADLGLVPADGAVWDKMGEFIAKMSSMMAGGQAVQKKDYIPMHELGGVPLLTQDVEGGKITSEMLVESVTRGASPAGSYEVPAGYKQEPMPTMEHKKK